MGRSKVGRNGARVNKRVVALVEEDLEKRYDKLLKAISEDRSTHIRGRMWQEVEAYELWEK